MQIYSCDKYFIFGVRALIEKIHIGNTCGIIVFDAGCGYVYIFHGDQLRHSGVNDIFGALICCRQSILNKNAPFEAYISCIEANLEPDISGVSMMGLSRREYTVINALYRVSDRRQLARTLGISEKTLSAHVMKALRKLGVKNTVTLYRMLHSWQAVLPTILLQSGPRG